MIHFLIVSRFSVFFESVVFVFEFPDYSLYTLCFLLLAFVYLTSPAYVVLSIQFLSVVFL